MKIDPEFHGETEHGDRCAVTATVIDPRLWIATQILAAELSRSDMDFHPQNKDARLTYDWALETADGLIAAHNATAGEVAGG